MKPVLSLFLNYSRPMLVLQTDQIIWMFYVKRYSWSTEGSFEKANFPSTSLQTLSERAVMPWTHESSFKGTSKSIIHVQLVSS